MSKTKDVVKVESVVLGRIFGIISPVAKATKSEARISTKHLRSNTSNSLWECLEPVIVLLE